MQPMNDGYTARAVMAGSDSPPNGGLVVSLAFLALIMLPLVAVSYPLASAGLLAGGVALVALGRSLARHLDRGTVRKLSLPGLGTVEYRFTRS
ncbi:hypothetical protein [Halorubrum sp. Boch-26]|uniref:hypothetical protein n=1 Tax=Halorubrum sp. Boch-26 TaxID=2994426 RepID=UPI002468F8D9|nr:hypothetical protein [Halorubrum sp. Boch-26]